MFIQYVQLFNAKITYERLPEVTLNVRVTSGRLPEVTLPEETLNVRVTSERLPEVTLSVRVTSGRLQEGFTGAPQCQNGGLWDQD